MIYIIQIYVKPSSEPSCQKGKVVLEENIPMRMEMFHHRIKQINQNDFVLICSDVSPTKRTSWNQTMPEKCL